MIVKCGEFQTDASPSIELHGMTLASGTKNFECCTTQPQSPPTHNGFDQRLAEYRELPTNDRGLFGFDKWLGSQVDVSVMRENADTGEYDRAQEANDYDFQMCSAVAGMQRVVHDCFCSRSETTNTVGRPRSLCGAK